MKIVKMDYRNGDVVEILEPNPWAGTRGVIHGNDKDLVVWYVRFPKNQDNPSGLPVRAEHLKLVE